MIGGGYAGVGGGSSCADASEEEKATEIINLIQELVEPEGWVDLGGDWASVRYYQGMLIVRAPDFVHRQIDGYPFVPRANRATAAAGQAPATVDRRYVTFTGGFSNVEIIDLKNTAPFTGAAGGGTP